MESMDSNICGDEVVIIYLKCSKEDLFVLRLAITQKTNPYHVQIKIECNCHFQNVPCTTCSKL